MSAPRRRPSASGKAFAARSSSRGRSAAMSNERGRARGTLSTPSAWASRYAAISPRYRRSPSGSFERGLNAPTSPPASVSLRTYEVWPTLLDLMGSAVEYGSSACPSAGADDGAGSDPSTGAGGAGATGEGALPDAPPELFAQPTSSALQHATAKKRDDALIDELRLFDWRHVRAPRPHQELPLRQRLRQRGGQEGRSEGVPVARHHEHRDIDVRQYVAGRVIPDRK